MKNSAFSGVRMIVALGVIFSCGVVFGGNDCRWTGDSGDGKWSTAGNWQDDVVPVSGAGDIVVIPGGSTVDVDVSSFSINRLVFEGSGDISVSGGRFDLDGTGIVLSNDTASVTIENDLAVSRTAKFYTVVGNVVVKGRVSVAASETLTVNIPDVTPQGTIRLLGTVNAPEAKLRYTVGQNSSSSRRHHAESALNVKELELGGDYCQARVILYDDGNRWQDVIVGYSSLIAAAPNVFGETAVIRPRSYYSSGKYDLSGFDQTIDRIAPSATIADNGGTVIVSDEPATLTMRATGDGSLGGRFRGRASLVWYPSDSRTFTATGVNDTTGDITVSNGTFVVGNSGSFADVRNLTIAEGAVFSLATDVANALAGLRAIKLDGTLVIGEDAATPFDGVVITVGANGKITVPSGKTVTVGGVRVNGERIADATYDTADWLTTGGGSVKVDSTTLPSAFAWKDPVSGSWAQSARWLGGQVPDGTKPVMVSALGDSYAVTVPADTTVEEGLAVENASGDGVATVQPAGLMVLSGSATHSIGRGGRISVPVGATLKVVGDSSTASTVRVLDVTAGGELAVAGECLVTNLYGLVSVSGGGRITVSDGLLKCIPYSSESGDRWDNRMDIGSGGTVDVTGGVFYPSIGAWSNCGLRFSGGTLNVSGSGRLRFNADTQEVLGFGRISLAGEAVVDIENNGLANLWMQAGGNNSSLYEINGETMTISAAGRASFAFGNTMLYLGYDRSNVNAETKTVFLYESTATSDFNRLSLGQNAFRGSSCSGVLGAGRINVGNYGFLLNTIEKVYVPKTFQVLSGGVTFSVTGGVLQVKGRYCEYAGVQIGNALPWSSNVPNRLDARLDISGGAVTNLEGSLALGTGNAKGVVRMTAGRYISTNTRPAFFGVGDGEGRWEMSGGSAEFAENIYLGLGATVTNLAYFSSADAKAGFSFGKTLDNCARGVLDIDGGDFATTGDIVCGADGNHGEITVGALGRLAAKDLILSNATDTITICVDGTNAGLVALSGRLDAASGVKLRIVGAETIPERARPLKIMTFSESSRPFAAADIEVARGVPVVQTGKYIRVGRPNGLLVIVK